MVAGGLKPSDARPWLRILISEAQAAVKVHEENCSELTWLENETVVLGQQLECGVVPRESTRVQFQSPCTSVTLSRIQSPKLDHPRYALDPAELGGHH